MGKNTQVNKMSSKKKSSKKASKKKKRDKDKDKDKERHKSSKRRHESGSHKKRHRSRSRSRSRHRSRRLSPSPIRVDKKKLLEIAKANLAAQSTLGTLGVVSEGVASSNSRSLNEFVEYYRKLSNEPSDAAAAHLERHPFQVKLQEVVEPVEKAEESVERGGSEQLSLQYPVSSGTQHRNEDLPSEADLSKGLALDVNNIVAQRLEALKRVASDPNDLQAYEDIRRADDSMQKWISAKQVPGLFVGSTDVKLLSAQELQGCYQAWVRKDALSKAAPVSDSIGRKLLEKMGWREGQGLGKNKEGTVDPLALDIKTDRKGLVSQEDVSVKALAVDMSGEGLGDGKHPVSALIELCNARKWLAPEFCEVAEEGPPHQRMFLMMCRVNGVEYAPGEKSFSKKMAKAKAALACLQALGLVEQKT